MTPLISCYIEGKDRVGRYNSHPLASTDIYRVVKAAVDWECAVNINLRGSKLGNLHRFTLSSYICVLKYAHRLIPCEYIHVIVDLNAHTGMEPVIFDGDLLTLLMPLLQLEYRISVGLHDRVDKDVDTQASWLDFSL